ncbi:hypothetical protein RI129_002861 [Pyrocoelia pectoralis]|uniref:MADF domain-containing protein n=1 Tax=Pyrocoelia pectoralis TaxID=417401 RepID=A0AAN7VPN3_9COLE
MACSSDEALIEIVRRYEVLYNRKHTFYHDNRQKENAWEEISREIHCSVATCKKRWNSLRDNYRKSLRKRQHQSGDESKPIKKWKYEDIMSFMTPFFAEREQTSNIQQNESESEEAVDIEQQEESNSIPPSLNSDTPTSSRGSSPTTISKVMNPTPKFSRQQHVPPMAQVLKNYFDQKQAAKSEKKSDSLQKFFDAMQETVRTFAPEFQIEIKSQISTLVSEYEFKNLMAQKAKQDQQHDEQQVVTPSPPYYHNL